MAVPVDRERLQGLIEHRYGSVDELAAVWQARYEASPQSTIKPRDRSSIYRWLDHGLPAKKDALYGFCALLDVDPIGIIETSRSFVEENFAKERRAFQLSVKRDTLLAPFRAVYLPGWRWPNAAIARDHYRRDWSVANFTHEADGLLNVYAALVFRLKTALPDVHPRVFHFAYQQMHAIDRLWRPYGVIIALGERIRLIAESGNWQEVTDEAFRDHAVAETFFGPRSTHFRVASLHDFTVEVEAPTTATNVVRFH